MQQNTKEIYTKHNNTQINLIRVHAKDNSNNNKTNCTKRPEEIK